MSLDQSSLAMSVNDQETLAATVSPDDATDKSVTWSSSDTSVCTVVDGLVTAVAATIEVETVDGNFVANCAVTVS